MTIQDWGAIGEIVGAIAVVVTLAYLATQIRFARLAASDASRQSRADSVREMELVTLNNREFRKAWSKADTARDSRMELLAERMGLSTDEAELVWHGCCAWTYIHWAQYRSMKTAEDHRELENLVTEFYSIPPMSTVWATDPLIKALLDPGFVVWVDGVLASARKS